MALPEYQLLPRFPTLSARWKQSAEDFVVDEVWEPEGLGQGEHVLLRIHKRLANTHWVARSVARFAGVRDMDVAYMGMKDRVAITTQYFSVYLGPRPEPDWSRFELEGVRLEYLGRVPRKLRRGQHAGNRFQIALDFDEPVPSELSAALDELRRHGFPNAFGEQRFGREGDNAIQALDWLLSGRRMKDRQRQGLYLSAIRSHFFNAVLAQRMAEGNWNLLLPGDIPVQRASGLDSVASRTCLSPSAALPGGREWSDERLPARERDLHAGYKQVQDALHRQGMRSQRRPLVAACPDLQWQAHSMSRYTLSFTLGVGCYASSLMSSLFRLCSAESGSESEPSE